MIPLQFAIYESLQSVAPLESEWRCLHANSTYPSVFNSFDFFMASAPQSLNQEDTLFVLKAYDRDGAVAIFPFQISVLRVGATRLRLLEYAAHEEVDKPYPIIRLGCEESAWKNLLGFLAANRKRWHRLDLGEVRDGLPGAAQVAQQLRLPGYWARIKEDRQSPIVSLDRPWTHFWDRHPKLRKKVRRMHNAFAGRLRFKIYDEVTDWGACLEKYLELESRGWKCGRVGIGKDPATLAIYRALFARLAAHRRLCFGFLFVDDVLVAAEIAYIEGAIVYFSHGTYDENFSRYSPGIVSTCLFLRHFHGRRFIEGDFLAGFADYLAPWADRIVPSRRLIVYRISPPVLRAFAHLALSRMRRRVISLTAAPRRLDSSC